MRRLLCLRLNASSKQDCSGRNRFSEFKGSPWYTTTSKSLTHNNCSASYRIDPPLFALRQCQSQAWMKEEGDANGLCYHTV